MKTGAELIVEERVRQIVEEGYDAEHDDGARNGELVSGAIAYCLPHTAYPIRDAVRLTGSFWPWDDEYWKPKGGVRDLVRAGALIAAEIDRRLRAEKQRKGQSRIITPEQFGGNPT